MPMEEDGKATLVSLLLSPVPPGSEVHHTQSHSHLVELNDSEDVAHIHEADG